jgi:hypothetical protein
MKIMKPLFAVVAVISVCIGLIQSGEPPLEVFSGEYEGPSQSGVIR